MCIRDRIGEDVTEKLSIVPAQFFVECHIYPKYACRPCETITAAPAVVSVIDGGLAAPALLAWVMVSKYADHLPLYRLERQAARSGAVSYTHLDVYKRQVPAIACVQEAIGVVLGVVLAWKEDQQATANRVLDALDQ